MDMDKITPAGQKRINKSHVYSFIYSKRQTSKQYLASSLQLSLPTVTQNIKELTDSGLIEKKGFFKSENGRRAQIIQCRTDARIGIGVDVLKESVNIVAANLYGDIMQKNSLFLCYTNDESYYSTVCSWINSFICSLPCNASDILGIGIATQGLISLDGQTIIYGPIMNSTGLSLRSFASHLQFPCIFVHDAEASAFAELWFNKDLTDAIYLGLNRNIGGAVIIDRKIHRGRLSRSGAIEHMCLVPPPHGKSCYCGRKGCIETYCSGNTLEKSASRSLDIFFQELRSGNTDCRKIWKQYLEYLALSIDNLRFVIDATVILGGLIASYFTKEDLSIIESLMQKSEIAELHLILGSCNEHASALGAALYYIEDFLKTI